MQCSCACTVVCNVSFCDSILLSTLCMCNMYTNLFSVTTHAYTLIYK